MRMTKSDRVQQDNRSVLFIRPLFVLIVTAILFGCVSANRAAAATGEIVEIETAGNVNIADNEILSKVRSRIGQPFDADVADEDAKRIAESLSGVKYAYYNTQLDDQKVTLTFVVVERNILREVRFKGTKQYKPRELEKKVGIERGDFLDPTLVEVGKRTLAEFYHKKGFPFTEITVDLSEADTGIVQYIIDEGPRTKITSIQFEGNDTVKAGELKHVIKTEKRKFLIFQQYFVEEKIDIDVVKLQTAYYQKGYLDVQVSARPEFSPDKKRVDIIFEIQEGPQYYIRDFVITGNTYFDLETLTEPLRSHVDEPFIEPLLESDVKTIRQQYRQVGFIDVQVDWQRIFVDEGRVDVRFEIEEGNRFRIGKIHITGNTQTQDKVVRQILDEYNFKPGQWYNADIARGDGTGKVEKILQRSLLTEKTGATINAVGDANDYKDAEVGIIQGRTGMILLGAGVASDSGVIGQFVYEQRNFDANDHPEDLKDFLSGQTYRGAGQQFRISLSPGTEVSQYSVTFTEPYFYEKPIAFDLAGTSYERYRESYDEKRTRGYTGFEWRFPDGYRHSISTRLENVKVNDLSTDAPQKIRDYKGSTFLTGVRFGITRDLTDDRYNPTKGQNFNVSYEQVTGDETFGILSGTHRWYKVIYEDFAERKTILATKVHAATTTINDAPPFEKFYAGGQGSLRGFEYRGVSTRGLQVFDTADPNNPIPEKEDPVGSDWIFLANAEVTVPLVGENFAALFFLDSGTIDTGPYRVSIGAGFQIMVPQWFGPVPMRFEFGVPLIKDDLDETQVFSFSVGRLF